MTEWVFTKQRLLCSCRCEEKRLALCFCITLRLTLCHQTFPFYRSGSPSQHLLTGNLLSNFTSLSSRMWTHIGGGGVIINCIVVVFLNHLVALWYWIQAMIRYFFHFFHPTFNEGTQNELKVWEEQERQ